MNILPTEEDVDQGSVTYLIGAGLSFGILDLQAALLGVPTLEFSIEPGHSQDLVFTFDSLLGAEAIGDYMIVVQKWDAAAGKWTTIDGLAEGATLLDIGILDTDTFGVEQRLGSGDYRAFVTFEGIGLSVLNTLAVEGTDYDHTEIAGYEAVPVSGNVMDNDPVTTSDTVVDSVEGVDVTGPDTEITGQYGTLSIGPDGSFTYTPFDTDGSGIGQVDAFTYTLVDTVSGATTTSTLYVQIGSDGVAMTWDPDDPGTPATAVFAATDDAATAEVVWANVVEDNYFEDSAGQLVGLGSQTYTSDTFEITDDMEVSGSITVAAILAAAANGTVALERETSPGTWETVASESFTVLVGGLGVVASIDLSEVDFTAGTYRVTASKTSVLSLTLGITTEVDVVHLDQFEVDSLTGHTGNLLANDDPGSEYTQLEIYDGTDFVAVTSSGPVTVTGSFGSLTVDADGDYVYTPAHTSQSETDTFTYRLVHPNGEVDEGSLTVTVEPSGAGVEAGFAAELALLLDDPGATIDFEDDQPADEPEDAEIAAPEEDIGPEEFSEFELFHPDPLFGADALGKVDEQPI